VDLRQSSAKLWKERYNFEPSAAWLEHVRLASVRLNDGGSGSFVSPRGLVMTNQHVAATQLQKSSTAERNLIRDGFYARTEAEELPCTDLEINVLVSYEDMTNRVRGAVKPGATDKDAAEQRRAEMGRIEKESLDRTGLRSDVVTLYSGASSGSTGSSDTPKFGWCSRRKSRPPFSERLR